MANDLDTTARNVGVDAIAALALRVALHSGDPGAANAADNELAGGGYARQAVSWNAASGGSASASNQPVFSIEGGDTVSWLSLWNTAGTVRYYKKDVTDEPFGGAGQYTVTSLALNLNDA